MKKIFLSLMVMVAAVAANAQIWVGGSLGFRTYDAQGAGDTETTFNIAPEVGYDLSEDLSIAIGLGYASESLKDVDDAQTTISVNPYARYKFLKAGNFNVFLDGGFAFKSVDDGANKNNAWLIGVRPGVAYSINENFSVVAHLGDGLVYRGGDYKTQNGIALDLANGLSFGVYYAF